MARRSGLLLLLGVVSMVVGPTRADFAADRAQCASQLMGMATCVPYVQGLGRSPTPDCCSGYSQVVDKSFKCLCLLIKDRNDPGLGIKFNLTLTLRLPSKCHAPTNVTDCPRVLSIPPNSADAKMFEQLADAMKAGAEAEKAEGSQEQHSTSNDATGKKEKKSSMNANGGDQGRELRSWLGTMCMWISSLLLSLALY